MLVQFSVRNFKTFKEKAVLSLIASNYDKNTREEENIVSMLPFGLRLVKSAVVYGANASGKSKLIEALSVMKYIVLTSSKESQKGEAIDVEPFRLHTATEHGTTEFEVVFLYKEEMYRYGFEVDSARVHAEWLYHRPKTKEVELFYREGQDFEVHRRKFSKGNTLVKAGLVRDNSLLLSFAAQFNDETAGMVLEWFQKIKLISGLREEAYQVFTMEQAQKPQHKKRIVELLKAADIGIQDIAVGILDLTELPSELKELIGRRAKEEEIQFFSDVKVQHRQYDADGQYVKDITFSMDDEESSGTKKFFALTGPIVDVLARGDMLVVDELDSKLHPNLVCNIVALFNSKEVNPNNAQLIFNTHNTNLLDSGLFRRDQIWFTEKDRYGAATLYSLSDFHSEVRKTENFEDNYVRGKYGAVPFLNDFVTRVGAVTVQSDEKAK